jgi:heme-degrading monooxygenase HmoA
MRREGMAVRSGLRIVWEFRVRRGRVREFEEHYGGDGVWALFFRRGRGYRETILLRDRDTAGRYLTIDVWDTLESYRAFSKANAAEYRTIDRRCRALTESERCLGCFERLPDGRVRAGRSGAGSPRAVRRSAPWRRTTRRSR